MSHVDKHVDKPGKIEADVFYNLSNIVSNSLKIIKSVKSI